MRGEMKDVGALLLALKPGKDNKPESEADAEHPETMLEEAMGVLSDALKKGDNKAAAKAFRIAMDCCGAEDGEESPSNEDAEREGP